MNQVLETIKNRFSCRSYKSLPVEQEKLEALAKAALQAPSALNKQPWEIRIITDKTLIDELDIAAVKYLEKQEDKTMYNRIAERGGKVYYNAPVMFLILKAKEAYGRPDVDCGILVQNIALAAASLNLDSVIVAMGRLPFIENEDYKKRVNWSEDYEFGTGILVGYGDKKQPPHEIDLSKVQYIE